MYLLLLSVIYLAFISLGLPDSLLGAAWPTVRVDFGVPISFMGITSMIISIGTVISGLMSERLTKKFGTRAVTIVSVILTAIAMLGFSLSKSFLVLCLFAIPYGLGAGAVDAALNNYVALHYTSKHMSWLHCFWGVGTIISPYIMSYALSHSVWTSGYRAVSFIQLAIAAVLIFTIPLWRVNKPKVQNDDNAKLLGISGALKIRGVPYLLLGFFCYCAAEATAMLWSSSYLESAADADKEQAAAFGAMFFIGMTVGRFISGFITNKLGDNRMIRIGVIIALVGCAALAIPSRTVMLIALIVIGVGCAPVYPSIIHATPDNFGAENSQGIIGIQMASAYIGSTLMPPIFGLIANCINIRLMPLYLGIFLILLLIMISRVEAVCKKDRDQTSV